MALAIACKHYLADLNAEHGGSLVYVVTGMPGALDGAAPTHDQQCPTGEHADVTGGWRITIPRIALVVRRMERGIMACSACVSDGHVDAAGYSTCMCGQGGCCGEALSRLLLEHAGLYVGQAVHSDATLVAGLSTAISGTPTTQVQV